jgi:hypothetical protein
MTDMQKGQIAAVLSRPLSEKLLSRPLTRLAYVARDGTPRTIPVAFVWNGTEVVVVTPANAPKLASLRANPAVALTIDTEDHPPKILLIRGQAELDRVDGIPSEFMEANAVPAEQYDAWEKEVRALYTDGMVRIVITPTWAKLIDFENTLPTAVEELMHAREARQRG